MGAPRVCAKSAPLAASAVATATDANDAAGSLKARGRIAETGARVSTSAYFVTSTMGCPSGTCFIETELMQYRIPVGGGPSGNT